MLRKEMLNQVRTYGVFMGVVLGMAAVLAVTSLAARGSLQRGLATELQETLDGLYPGGYVVGAEVEPRAAWGTSCAVFRLARQSEEAPPAENGILLRIPTLVGAMPAVFLHDGERVSFAGYALDCGRARGLLFGRASTQSLRYWERELAARFSGDGEEL